jgi:hypothetical protein
VKLSEHSLAMVEMWVDYTTSSRRHHRQTACTARGYEETAITSRVRRSSYGRLLLLVLVLVVVHALALGWCHHRHRSDIVMIVLARISRAVTQGSMCRIMPRLARHKSRVVDGRVACRRPARRSPKALADYVVATVAFVLTIVIQVMLRSV